MNSAFDFVSFDAAKFIKAGDFEFPANAASIVVTGTKVDFSTVTATFNLTIIPDGPGGAADFQTFFLPSTFVGLSKVNFTETPSNPGAPFFAGEYMMDNLNVAPFVPPVVVPEPGSAALLIGGGTLLALARQRSHRS